MAPSEKLLELVAAFEAGLLEIQQQEIDPMTRVTIVLLQAAIQGVAAEVNARVGAAKFGIDRL